MNLKMNIGSSLLLILSTSLLGQSLTEPYPGNELIFIDSTLHRLWPDRDKLDQPFFSNYNEYGEYQEHNSDYDPETDFIICWQPELLPNIWMTTDDADSLSLRQYSDMYLPPGFLASFVIGINWSSEIWEVRLIGHQLSEDSGVDLYKLARMFRATPAYVYHFRDLRYIPVSMRVAVNLRN